MSSFGTVAGTIALGLLGVLGLFMSLCGGGVTLAGLTTQGMTGVLVMSVPSLLAGLGLVWLAWHKLRPRPARPPGDEG